MKVIDRSLQGLVLAVISLPAIAQQKAASGVDCAPCGSNAVSTPIGPLLFIVAAAVVGLIVGYFVGKASRSSK